MKGRGADAIAGTASSRKASVARLAFPVVKTKRGGCGSMASCVASETPSLPGRLMSTKTASGPQLGAKTQARLALDGRPDDLYLTGLVQQRRQVLGGQGLVFDNNRSDPDPHENRS
jgi:hypothetical protein